MDPFEDKANRDRLEADRERNVCMDTVKLICSEIRKINSPLHQVIEKKLSESSQLLLTMKDMPKDLQQHFVTLDKCNEKYKINEEFRNISKYLFIEQFVGCKGSDCTLPVPYLSFKYNKDGKL